MKKFWILLTLFSLLLTGCATMTAQSAQDLSTRQIRVTTTTGMITDIVANIGGERVQVVGLMGPGVDPHLYKATESDANDLLAADVIFYNGLHLEAGMAHLLERMAATRRVVAISDPIDRSVLMAPPEFANAYDPHIWFDVTLWMQASEQVRDTLIAMDPGSEAIYRQNAETYLQALSELDQYVRDQADRIPAERRVLITAHDAFGYFGRAYGFEVIGLQGLSTQTEASTGDVHDLALMIVQRQIPAIFVESSVPQRNIEAVQAAVRAQGWDVHIGGQLFSDAMGTTGTPEGTYIGMVRHNIDTIVAALAQ